MRQGKKKSNRGVTPIGLQHLGSFHPEGIHEICHQWHKSLTIFDLHQTVKRRVMDGTAELSQELSQGPHCFPDFRKQRWSTQGYAG